MAQTLEPKVLYKISRKEGNKLHPRAVLYLLIFVPIHGTSTAFLIALQISPDRTSDTLQLNDRKLKHKLTHSTHTMHTCTHTCMHTHRCTHTHTQTHTQHTHMQQTHMHTYNTHTNRHKHLNTHTHIHTNTHTHKDRQTDRQTDRYIALRECFTISVSYWVTQHRPWLYCHP